MSHPIDGYAALAFAHALGAEAGRNTAIMIKQIYRAGWRKTLELTANLPGSPSIEELHALYTSSFINAVNRDGFLHLEPGLPLFQLEDEWSTPVHHHHAHAPTTQIPTGQKLRRRPATNTEHVR